MNFFISLNVSTSSATVVTESMTLSFSLLCVSSSMSYALIRDRKRGRRAVPTRDIEKHMMHIKHMILK